MTDRRKKLREVFEAVFELPAGSDLSQVRQGETGAWDSMGHVTLITAIESEFGIEVSAEDSIEMTSFENAEWILDDILAERS